ncbi:hypothetical protein DLD77_08165 [Chitinophaga alhagiae]|uniref:Outer membrane protein beta-barrel domain-containing protein n=1 Tax=Chitinophaga alhagiae TaxID=2203219 RepID=A0ABM6WCD5_9BACT|nr:TonB-dependent receptor [Chitinophaga alhagiae]AWO01672.1 hypothetical protein DLD77_08165 [Chitinophaga alhagiae]
MAQKIPLCSLLVLAGTAVQGQQITGIVRNHQQQPLAAATVVLLRTDSSIAGTVRSNVSGLFSFDGVAAGRYLLQASHLGYGIFCCAPAVSPSAQNIIITLQPLAQQLEEVEVQSQRPPPVERRLDGLVYNPASDVVAAGSNAQDLLQRVPFITVNQDGEVLLHGNNVRVFINNKPAEFYSTNVPDLLRQLTAADIARIEVITHPSARYDAEGASAVLQIWLKRNRLRGLTGTLNANAHRLETGYTLKLNYRLSKIYGAAEVLQGFYNSYNNETSERHGLNTFANRQYTDNTSRGRTNFFTLEGGWEPDSTQSLDVLLRLGIFPVKRRNELEAQQLEQGDVSRAYSRTTWREAHYRYYLASLTYTRRFSRDRELSVIAGANNRVNRSGYTMQQVENAQQNYREKNINAGSNYDLMLQTDYVHPFSSSAKLETGLKYIARAVNSDYELYAFNNNTGYQHDSARSQLFDFLQNVAAVYASYEQGLGKWKIRAGLRYEYTQLKAQRQAHAVALQPYGTLVPNLLVYRDISSKVSTTLSYARRIRRPDPYHLTPAADYSDSLNITEGNPDLVPELLHHVEAGFSALFDNNSSLNLALYYDHADNSIQSTRVMHANGIIYNSYANLAGQRKAGASLNANMNIGQYFKLNTNLVYNYMEFRSSHTFTYNYMEASATATRQLPKGFGAEGNIRYSTRYPFLYGYVGNWLTYYLGVNKKLADGKYAVSIRFQNFLNPYNVSEGFFFGESYTENFTRRFRNPFVRAGFSYKFGKAYNNRPQRERRNAEGL